MLVEVYGLLFLLTLFLFFKVLDTAKKGENSVFFRVFCIAMCLSMAALSVNIQKTECTCAIDSMEGTDMGAGAWDVNLTNSIQCETQNYEEIGLSGFFLALAFGAFAVHVEKDTEFT